MKSVVSDSASFTLCGLALGLNVNAFCSFTSGDAVASHSGIVLQTELGECILTPGADFCLFQKIEPLRLLSICFSSLDIFFNLEFVQIVALT